MDWEERFRSVAARKTAAAAAADIRPLTTNRQTALAPGIPSVGNAWTRSLYDGGFHLPPPPSGRPAVSLVFVQDAAGNTATENPGELGGGTTDTHLIYEGLSRAAADGVMAGATTAAGPETFFSVWHPEIAALRQTLGLPRHPAQLVVVGKSRLDLRGALLFNIPEVPVFIVAAPGWRPSQETDLADRPWVRVVRLESQDWRHALARLREEHGLSRISAIGGRTTASSLIDAGVVQDLVLTTTSSRAAEPGTPFYVGHSPPRLELIVEKRGSGSDGDMKVEHLRLGQQLRAPALQHEDH